MVFLYKELVDEFQLDCRIRNLSKRTIETYGFQLNVFFGRISEDERVNVQDISRTDIKRFIVGMQDSAYSASYINQILKIVKVFFDFLVDEKIIEDNFARQIKPLRTERKLMNTFTDEEVAKVIEYFSGQGFLNRRNKLIIELMADCGLRVSEVRGLKDDSIRGEYLQFTGKGDKERIVPLSPYIQKSIAKYRRTRYDYFNNLRVKRELEDCLLLTKSGNEMKSNAMIEILVKEAREAVGVRDDVQRKSCHSFRHYYAQSLLRANVNLFTISRLLGHSSVKTTQIYLNSITDVELMEGQSDTTPLMMLIKDRKL